MAAQDFEFSRMLDELDEPESTGFGTPVAEPSQAARDAFDLPGATRKLIDDVVVAREKKAATDDYVAKGQEAVSALTDPQQYKEFAKGVIPGAVSMGGSVIQAPDAVSARGQQGAAKFGRKQLEIMDRIDRGESVPEMEDPIGYAYMSTEQRQAARRDQQQATAEFNPTPIGERPFFKAGEKVKEYAKDLMPAAPGYEESVGRQLGEGTGSLVFGLPVAYFGAVPAGLAFGSAGVGEATQRAVDFDRKEKAAGRPGLTEDQISLAGILGVGPGATDLLPVEVLMGRLPLPLPPVLRRPVAMAIGRIGGQALIEGAQEGGQAFLQNLIAREVYNPSQPLVDGIEHEMGIGAGVGGIAQTAKEIGTWLLKSGAIRKKKGVHDSLVEHEKAQKEAAEAVAEDPRALAASQEGPTPRLEPGQSAVRGSAPAEPAIQDAERLLSEIESGTIAEPASETAAPATPAAEAPAAGASRPDGAARPVSEGGTAPVPTFQDVFALLPRDKAGDPDIGAFFAATGGRNYNELSDVEKVALVQQFRGEAPADRATEAPAAVSAPEATSPASETAAAPAAPQAAPASLTEAIQQAAPQIEEATRAAVEEVAQQQVANTIDDAARSRFSEVLGSNERRSNWGKAAGLSEEQVTALINEAVTDGRLTMRKGQPVRTAKARVPSPQTEVARAATSVPMGRAAEVRLEKITNNVAYKHAAAILGAGRNRDGALKKLSADKKATRAVLDEIHLAVTGKASKSLRTKQAVIDALAKVEEAVAQPTPTPAEAAETLATGHLAALREALSSGNREAADAAVEAIRGDKSLTTAKLDELARTFVGGTKKYRNRADAIREIDLRLSANRQAARRLDAAKDMFALGPADSYARRSLSAFNDPVSKAHYQALLNAGTNVEPVIQQMAKDRRLTLVEQQEIAEAYVGGPVSIDPFDAIRETAAQRGRDARSALLHGFSPEVSPSNLRVRDDLDTAVLIQRLQDMAERLPRGTGLAIAKALRIDLGDRIGNLEGAALSAREARVEFGIEAERGIEKLIAVSLEYGPDVAMRTFTHEEIHLLRKAGVLRGKDWETLAGIAKRRPKKAEAERILDSMLDSGKIDQATFEDMRPQAGKLTYRQLYQIDERYGEFLRGDENLLVEETVAHAAADWANGREFASPIERVFMRIRDLLEAIQNALNDLGFRSANDIFESIWAGELTRKMEEARERRFEAEERALDWMQGEGITAMAIANIAEWTPPWHDQRDVAELDALAEKVDPSGEFFDRATTWAVRNHIRGSFGEFRTLLSSDADPYSIEEHNGAFFLRSPGSAASYRSKGEAEAALAKRRENAVEQRIALRHAAERMLAYADAKNPDHTKRTVHRWVAIKSYEKLKGGETIVDPAFMSTTKGFVPKHDFIEPMKANAYALLRINQWSGLDIEASPFIADTDLNRGEQEVLLPPGRTFKVTSVKRNDMGFPLIEMDELDAPPAADPSAPTDAPILMAAFAGEKAKTADQDALASAKEMEAKGEDRADIWKQTGWFKGVDGRWRFEIDDSKSKLRPFGPDFSLLHAELTHDPLFEAYPEMADFEFNRTATRSFQGSFTPGGILPSRIDVSKRAKDRRSVTLHEAQHGIQDIEGLAEGGDGSLRIANPITGIQARRFQQAMDLRRSAQELGMKVAEYVARRREWASDEVEPMAFTDLNGRPFDVESIALAEDDARISELQERQQLSDGEAVYRRLAGEVEARTVQKRMDMSEQERRERPPWMDYDVPEDRQIVRMPVEGEQRSMASVDRADSDAFRAWFGDSKAVDASGKPLVMYHGTARGGFDAFDTYGSNYGLMGQGGYFTDNPEVASGYTNKGAKKLERQGRDPAPAIYPVYLSIKNPMDMEAPADIAAWSKMGDEYGAEFTEGMTNEQAYRELENALQDEMMPSYEGAEIMQDTVRGMGHDGITHVGGGRVDADGVRHRVFIAFDPSQIKSVNNQGTFDPNDDRMMASFRDWMPSRSPTPPQATPQGDSPGLNKIISDLKKTLGMTVSQGLWGFSVQQRQETDDGRTYTRSARVRPPSNVRGQFDRETGNVSLRQSRDIKTLAHEGGHYLESILGTDLGAVKQQFAQALTGEPQPMPAALSEGFARWFESYILDPDAAEARAPGMTEAFEELLEAERPDMLEGFDTIQQEYQRYIKSAPIGEVAAGLSSQYDGTTWRELSKDRAFDNISGKLSAGYQGVIDSLNVAGKGIQYLLKTADANGIRDEDGRPISIKVGDNFYKRLRLFAGSFNRGRVWLEKGVSDLETGRVIGPSLKSALEKAIGAGKFNMEKYKSFNQYLVSIRAIAEYDRLDQKAATLKQYDDTLARIANARPTLAERIQRDQSTLDRRQDALTRANAMLADRRRMLGAAETRLETVQDRLDGVLADIAEAGEMDALAQDIADPLAENAVSENYGAMVARRRRQVQNLERDQRQALRTVERLSDEVSRFDVESGMLQAEIAQLREIVDRGRQQVTQLDEMATRIRKERELASNRGASRPPTAEPRAVHERVIKELGTPEFQEAAQMVHDFTFSLLEARRQAGFISQELFDELAKRRDWYVPFWRDMSDIEGAGAMFPGSGVKKWSMFKKFDGSDRSILMPLEILSEEAYSTAQQIAFNDVVKTMVGLAERVGPGGGKVAERLARSENMEANEETFGKIKQMAMDLGVDPIDAHMITQRMEMNFSDGDIRVILSPENLGPTAKPQLPLWENGERVMVRLPDPAFGRDLFEAINGLGKEMGDILVKALALPAQALRIGVTTHPDFIFRNIWRDIWTAWKLTGAAPFITQYKGFQLINEGGTVDGMSGEDFRRLYNEAGGIAGGINVNAQIADQRRDVKDLMDSNVSYKAVAAGAALGGFTGLAAGSTIGSMAGLMFGGPVGAAVGFKIGATVGGLVGGVGAGYGARHGEVWRFVESFETATRMGVAAHAYKRAKTHNPDLSDTEAILEAAFVSRDIMDWNRRGSKMLAATRLVTFLNAQIQGLDKQIRQMGAQGDRGSAIKKRLAIVFKHQAGDILSKDEERDLADAYKSYLRWGAISLMLMGLFALSADDDDYQDIKDETKWTHSWFKSLGIWFRLPKPFELAVPANVGEIIWDSVAGRDQRMGERIVNSMYEVLAPPGLPQAGRLAGGLLFNRDRQGIFGGRSREIVGDNLASRPPHERYHAFSSEFAIDLSRAMYQIGIPQSLIPAPVKTDFVLSAAGAYWGREVQNSYQTAKTMAGMSTRPDRKATDFPILRGFTGEAARMSRAVNDMFTMISREGGEMTIAANEYKQLMDDRGRPAEAETWLMSLDKEQRVWALTQYYGSRSEKREHPLERARQADAINREIMRDTVMDRLAPKRREGRKQVRDFDERIELTPAKKLEVIDILARLSQIEARNTMILLNRKGFEGMDIKDPQLVLDELKAANREVHDLLQERRDKKVSDWPDVQREWPKYRERVLKESVNAF